MLRADHGDKFVRAVRIGRVRQHVLLRIQSDRVLVSAENIDRVAADAQARAGNRAAIDRIAHRRIRRAGAFRAHVAFGRKAGHQIVACGERRANRAFGNGFVERLRIFRAGMQKKMHVRIDQTGHQRAIAEIDRRRVTRMIDMTAHSDDAFAVDQHFAWSQDFSAVDIEQSRSVENGRVCMRGNACQ